MQVTQLAAIVDAKGATVEAAGVRLTYSEGGQQIEETRRPLPNGLVRRVLRNVITGTTTSADVPAGSLEAV